MFAAEGVTVFLKALGLPKSLELAAYCPVTVGLTTLELVLSTGSELDLLAVLDLSAFWFTVMLLVEGTMSVLPRLAAIEHDKFLELLLSWPSEVTGLDPSLYSSETKFLEEILC